MHTYAPTFTEKDGETYRQKDRQTTEKDVSMSCVFVNSSGDLKPE